ncbi:MAG TPA: hypothetical protein VH934_14115 [Xanthobacteraceae bacterium]|jgi:hypothetical protein
MNGPSKRAPNDRPKRAEAARRQGRLGAALRENLKRRKAQAKGRAAAGAEHLGSRDGAAEADRKPHDSAGIAADKKDG